MRHVVDGSEPADPHFVALGGTAFAWPLAGTRATERNAGGRISQPDLPKRSRTC
jgi:hypothetical protein